MHCNIMIYAHINIVTHYDVTMIPSNIITYCDVIMGHGTKKIVSTMLSPQKVVLRIQSPLEIWVWRFHSKQAIARHNH